MNCHDFLEWADALTRIEWDTMTRALYNDITMTMSLAYMMVNSIPVRAKLGRVYHHALTEQQHMSITDTSDIVPVELAVMAAN